ncbi:MAG TPA: hypothetical protein VGA70_13460 [Longimicrobiales bacterium]
MPGRWGWGQSGYHFIPDGRGVGSAGVSWRRPDLGYYLGQFGRA